MPKHIGWHEAYAQIVFNIYLPLESNLTCSMTNYTQNLIYFVVLIINVH